MNSDDENPSSLSLLSLPDEIITSCLAWISRLYYPKLSLVSKTFDSIILSQELIIARIHLKTEEKFLHVCLQFPNDSPSPSWFSLWIKPDQTLTNDLGDKKRSSRNTLLVPMKSLYHDYYEPMFVVTVGSELYAISQNNAPSFVLWVIDKDSNDWREASRMIVARESAAACVLDGKIYVMGGCKVDESANWGEVFDTKTQTWESLPDPGIKVRASPVKRIDVKQGKLYVISNKKKKDYVYDPEKGKWDTGEKTHPMCVIENVLYCCDKKKCWWYDKKQDEWRMVRGLAMLNRNRRCCIIEATNYGGKLLILWDKFVHLDHENKKIWCAVIALERRNNGDEVWGNIEWASVVHTVPRSYGFVRSLLTLA